MANNRDVRTVRANKETTGKLATQQQRQRKTNRHGRQKHERENMREKEGAVQREAITGTLRATDGTQQVGQSIFYFHGHNTRWMEGTRRGERVKGE